MWLHKVNECASIYGWTEKQLVYYALPKLRGLAQRWYEGVVIGSIFLDGVAIKTNGSLSLQGKLWTDACQASSFWRFTRGVLL